MIHFSGLTDLPPDSRVEYEIRPADIETRKKTAEDIDGITGRTSLSGKDGLNGWSVDINMTFWRTGKYIISAWPGQSDPRYGDTKAFFVPLNDTIVNGAGKESVRGEIILNEIFPSEQSSFPVSVTPKPTPDKSINKFRPSSEFLEYKNAPAITPGEKDKYERLIADSKGFEKFKDISHGPVTVVWAYPYTGRQMISTVIGSEQSDVYGLYYADYDPKNDSLVDDGFVNRKKYW